MPTRLLGCVAVALFVVPSASGQDSPFAIARQVTRSITMDPSLSPDGSRMVYITVVGGVEQLFTSKIDGSDVRQITHDPADHEDPAWSPDGGKIAFVSGANGLQVVSLMNPDGTGR